MRAVVQRVSSARVRVDEQVVGAIERGLLVFVGVSRTDGLADVAYIAAKVRDLRLFPDQQGKVNLSIGEVAGSVLIVSQFTLLADCRKGRRPSFDAAAPPHIAAPLYQGVIDALRGDGIHVETGVFQAHMDVELINDGPVTVLLDSARTF
jgi:D-tyrosyl-tRNA(Tyr) deacylase